MVKKEQNLFTCFSTTQANEATKEEKHTYKLEGLFAKPTGEMDGDTLSLSLSVCLSL